MKKNLLFYLSALLILSSCETEHLYGPDGILEVDLCDTIDVTYTAHIKPIIDDKCESCHNSNATSGNVILTTYDDVKDAVNTRQLKEIVNYEPGNARMPPSGKMSNCVLLKINTWIKEGMKE